MSTSEFGSFTLLLVVLIALAQLLGYLFTRLRQPRVIGEILAGVLIGPAVLGQLAPAVSHILLPVQANQELAARQDVILSFLYNFGLLLLMFASGAETKGLFRREDWREVGWLAGIGTAVPFLLALAVVPFLPLQPMIGRAGARTPLLLVVCIAVAVTSIPVISRIMHDLNILHTRFARLVLGVAVMEDMVLWAVLALATALAASGTFSGGELLPHVAGTALYFGAGLTVAPGVLRRVTPAAWNLLARSSPVAYVVVVLLTFSAIAAAFGISLIFAAFVAGYALVKDDDSINDAVVTVSKVAFAVFIPVYFTVVGYRLDLSKTFSWKMLVVFLLAACVVKLLSASLGARIAGFPLRDSVNLAVALNARGGPGIVLASVAYDAAIINASFYTTLVIVAVLTSQMAGAWIEYVLRSGRPLLSAQPSGAVEPAPADEELAA